jgi:hypothetical protein
VLDSDGRFIDFDNKRVLAVMNNFLNESYAKEMSMDRLAQLMKIFVEDSKNKSKVAHVRSSISATLPAAILCMDDNGYLTTPKENVKVCRDSDSSSMKWPVISDGGGQWNEGCEMSVERIDGVIKSFEYCATLPDGSVVRCGNRGCKLDK